MENVDWVLRFFFPIYIIIYILYLYVYNISAFKKRYGIDPRVVKKEDAISYLLQQFRDVIFWTSVFCMIVYSVFPGIYEYLVPVRYLQQPLIQWMGLAILVISPFLVKYSQGQLRGSWRIGVDRREKEAELITDGLFSISRNPITISMMLTTVGLFLAIPNMITFALVTVTYFACSVRILVEEEHLEKLHGEAYLEYRAKTPKWL